MSTPYPDVEGQLYTTGAPDATYTEAEARQRAADRREVEAAAGAAGASALADAKAYTDQKVTGLATSVAMNAADALTLSNAKTYTDSKVSPLATVASVVAGDLQALADAKAYADAQLAEFSGNGVETVFGTVTLGATGEPIREFYTTGTTTFSVNGTTVQIAAHTAVVWRRTGVGSWGYQEVPDEWTTPTPTPDTTAPVAGTLAVTTTDVTADLSVTGASDDRGVTGYAFQVNGGAWSSWQTGPTYTATGLSASTAYQFRHKVRDAAGNEAQGTGVSATTTEEQLVWTTVAVDSFDGAAGSIVGRVTPTGGKPWRGLALTERASSATTGNLALDGAGSVAGQGNAGLDLATSAAVRATLTFSTSASSHTRIGLGVKPGAGDYFFSGAQIVYFANEGFKLFYGTGAAQLNSERAKNTTVTGPLTNAVLVVEVQGTALTATLNGTPLITNTLPASLQGSTVTLESTNGNVTHDLKVETA